MKSFKGELSTSLLKPTDVLQRCCTFLTQRSSSLLLACNDSSNWKPNRIQEISKTITNNNTLFFKSVGFFLLIVLWVEAGNKMQNVEIFLVGSEGCIQC